MKYINMSENVYAKKKPISSDFISLDYILPDLNSNCMILKLLLKVFKKLIWKKKSAEATKAKNMRAKSLGTDYFLFFHKNYVVRVE